jgi:hypothetical protein
MDDDPLDGLDDPFDPENDEFGRAIEGARKLDNRLRAVLTDLIREGNSPAEACRQLVEAAQDLAHFYLRYGR